MMGQSGDPCLFVVGYVIYLCVVGAFRYSVRAMRRVGEIRERRQALFIKNRSVLHLSIVCMLEVTHTLAVQLFCIVEVYLSHLPLSLSLCPD